VQALHGVQSITTSTTVRPQPCFWGSFYIRILLFFLPYLTSLLTAESDNLYSLISNYEISNKYIKQLNNCAHLFNMVATIIQIRGLRIIYIKYFKVNR
jgi:uncharacterized membrane protein